MPLFLPSLEWARCHCFPVKTNCCVFQDIIALVESKVYVLPNTHKTAHHVLGSGSSLHKYEYARVCRVQSDYGALTCFKWQEKSCRVGRKKKKTKPITYFTFIFFKKKKKLSIKMCYVLVYWAQCSQSSTFAKPFKRNIPYPKTTCVNTKKDYQG